MEFANLGLAYSAGLLAVLAPCALPMLPSFVAYYMNAEERENKLEDNHDLAEEVLEVQVRDHRGVDNILQLFPQTGN